jgi:hypothetical protein
MSVMHRFKEYCIKNAVQILPDDIKFLKEQLLYIPQNEHRATLKKYYDEWNGNAALYSEQGLNQNYGRFKANEWLREEIAKWRKGNK